LTHRLSFSPVMDFDITDDAVGHRIAQVINVS
jgi:hypothetical protein